MANPAGLVLISPLIQEALSNANSFAGKIKLAPNLMEKVAELKTYLTEIQAVVEGAEETQESDLAIRTWLEMLSDAVYDAVDRLDKIIYFRLQKMQELLHASSSDPLDGDRRRMKEVEIQSQKPQEQEHAYDEYGLQKEVEIQSQKLQEQVQTFSSSNFTVDFDGGKEFLDKFATLNESLAKITKEVDFIDGVVQFRKKNLANTTGYGIVPLFDDSQVIGRENDVQKILQSLENLRSQHQISGISIVGMAGIGKTTVARSIENKAREEGLYDEVAWVSVSDDFNHQRILSEVSQYCDNFDAKVGEGTTDELIQFLGEELMMKNFLLILDDLWQLDPHSWNVFAGHLSKIVNLTDGRCSIVLTTQSKRVPYVTVEENLFSVHMHDMGLLSDCECWLIMKETILRSSFESSIQSDLECIGKEIAKKCGGLAIAAVIIGETLSRQMEIDEWMAIKNNKVWLLNSEDGTKILSVLKERSFDRLSSPLKKCFSYCSLFPKGSTIERDDLVQLWMAQGFLHMTLEDVGDEYFSDLLSDSFFQNEVRDSWGNIISCKMHDIMHDLALFVSKGETLIWELPCSFNDNINVRHLRAEESLDSYDVARIPREVVQRLRSLFWENSCILDRALFEFRSLICLRLNCHRHSFLPHDLENLKFLKYLSISNDSFMTSTSFSLLCNLETLKLTHCHRLTTLQIGHSIKNLKLSHCIDLILVQSIGELAFLQIFELISCNQLISLPIELGSCISLKKLRIYNCPKLASVPSMHGLSSLEILEIRLCRSLMSLTAGPSSLSSLKKMRIDHCPKLASVPSMHGLSSLESFEISGCGRLTSLIVGPSSLSSLKKLRIDYCPKLASVPSMHGLSSLESFEISGCRSLTSLTAGPGSFISLKNLRLSFCSFLTSFQSVEGLSSLENLELKQCERLMSLTAGPATLVSLKNLTITGCPLLISIPSIQWSSSLESLELRNHNGLTCLPISLESCISLKNLRISYSPGLVSIPSIHGLNTCVSLESLELEGCDELESLLLSELSSSCISLQKLIIRNCPRVEYIPKDMKKLPSLVCLEISECTKLSSIPEEWLGSLTSLTELTLGPFWEELEEFPGLTYLQNTIKTLNIVGWPKLKSLPPQLEQLTALEELEMMSFDQVEVLPEWLGNLSSLRRLKIGRFNKLRQLPSVKAMRRLSNLQNLHIWGCQQYKHINNQKSSRECSKVSHIARKRVE